MYTGAAQTLNQVIRKENYTGYTTFLFFVCYIALHYRRRNSCLPIGLDSIEELEVTVASISPRGVAPGTEVGVAFTAELYAKESRTIPFCVCQYATLQMYYVHTAGSDDIHWRTESECIVTNCSPGCGILHRNGRVIYFITVPGTVVAIR